MNATGEGDARQYYDGITAAQHRELEPKLIECCHWMQPYLLPDVDPDELKPQFTPVWSPSQQEQVEMHLQQAQADDIYITNGVLSANEVRQNRFDGGYSFETSTIVGTEAPPLENPGDPDQGVAPGEDGKGGDKGGVKPKAGGQVAL